MFVNSCTPRSVYRVDVKLIINPSYTRTRMHRSDYLHDMDYAEKCCSSASIAKYTGA